MSQLKKVWLTKHSRHLSSLSLESEIVKPEYMKIKVYEQTFPDKPTVEHPERHTICLKLFDEEDLHMIVTAIEMYLSKDERGLI